MDAPHMPPALARKVGPLPVWAWGGLGAGGLLYVLNRRKAVPVAATDPSLAGAAGAATGADTGLGFDPGGGGVVDPRLGRRRRVRGSRPAAGHRPDAADGSPRRVPIS